MNFQGVDGNAMSIQDAVPPNANMTQGSGATAADQIQIMDADGNYVAYYLSNGKAGKASYPETTGKWVVTSNTKVPADVKIQTGTAFWFVSKTGAVQPYTITVAGSVLMSSNDPKVLTQAYSLIGNPYPCDIPLNGGIEAVNGTQGAGATVADQIQIMGDDGNYVAYYLSNGKAGKASYPETEGKWVLSSNTKVPTDAVLPAGKGAWFVRKNEATSLNFVSPLAK